MLFSRPLYYTALCGVSCVLAGLFFAPGQSSAQSKPPAGNFDALAKHAEEARDADRVDEALSLYRKALVLRPTWAEGWWSLGTLQYDSSTYSEAAKSLRHVINFQPDSGSAWVMLGLCEFELGEVDQALGSLEHGRSLGGTDAQLYDVGSYHIGLLQLRKELYASPLKTLQKLAADGVRTDEIALGLAMSLLIFQPSTLPAENTLGRDVFLGVGRAETLSAAGKSEEARQVYLSLVQQYPDYPGLHFAYGLLLLTIHEPDEAVVQWQAALRINPKPAISHL